VREFVEIAFAHVDRQIAWKGQRNTVEERGVDRRSGKVVVKIDPRYFRPTEVDLLIGDASKAREKLGWSPKTPFHKLVSEMMESDLAAARKEASHGS
jgi:GDPmannose 4,6-dehydratase